MSVGTNIKYYRVLMRLNQEELARKIGVSNKTVSSWEIDRTQPKMRYMTKLCDIFKIDISELTAEIVPRDVPEYDKDTIEIIDLLRRITTEQKNTILAMLRSFVN